MLDNMGVKLERVFTPMNKYIFGLYIFFCITSCDKKSNTVDINNDFFPALNVDFYINLSLPSASPLLFPQGWVYQQGGYKGIIVYKNSDEYIAFDRACPFKTDSLCSIVSVDSNNFLLRCGQYNPSFVKCCGSEFYISTGGVKKSPATRPLKQYYVKQEGNSLHVTSSPF